MASHAGSVKIRWIDAHGRKQHLPPVHFPITKDPPPEVQAAGHDRRVVAIRKENVEAWLNPDPRNLQTMYDILDHPVDAYFGHQLVNKERDGDA
jgi:putative SOS response-associated peptidase YedK